MIRTSCGLALMLGVAWLLTGCGRGNGLPAELTSHLAERGITITPSSVHAPLSSRGGYVVARCTPQTVTNIIATFKLVRIQPDDRQWRWAIDRAGRGWGSEGGVGHHRKAGSVQTEKRRAVRILLPPHHGTRLRVFRSGVRLRMTSGTCRQPSVETILPRFSAQRRTAIRERFVRSIVLFGGGVFTPLISEQRSLSKWNEAGLQPPGRVGAAGDGRSCRGRCQTALHGARASEQSAMPNIRWPFLIAGLWLAFLAAPLPAAPSPGARIGGNYLIDVWETEDGLPRNSSSPSPRLAMAISGWARSRVWRASMAAASPSSMKAIRRSWEAVQSCVCSRTASGISGLGPTTPARQWCATARCSGPRKSISGARSAASSPRVRTRKERSGFTITMGNCGVFRRGQFNPLVLTPMIAASIRRSSRKHPDSSGSAPSGVVAPLARSSRMDRIQPIPVAEELPVQKLDFLLASQQGGFWRLADGRIQKWRNRQLERDWGPNPWGSFKVTSACEDRDGNLVVGTLGAGLFWLDAAGKATTLSTNEGLSHNLVLAVHRDFEGNVWAGTDGGGLNRVKRKEFQTLAEVARHGRPIGHGGSGWRLVVRLQCRHSGLGRWRRQPLEGGQTPTVSGEFSNPRRSGSPAGQGLGGHAGRRIIRV